MAGYFCYFNLHKKCFSVKYKGKVIKHLDQFWGVGCEFRVSEPGRQRVIKNKRKAVHAYVVCDVIDQTFIDTGDETAKVRYNPYEGPHFMSDGQPIHFARVVKFTVVNKKPVVEVVY